MRNKQCCHFCHLGIPLIGVFKQIKEPTVFRRFFFLYFPLPPQSPAPTVKPSSVDAVNGLPRPCRGSPLRECVFGDRHLSGRAVSVRAFFFTSRSDRLPAHISPCLCARTTASNLDFAFKRKNSPDTCILTVAVDKCI